MALTTDDIVAIQQLYTGYCHAIDELDGESFSNCFSPQGSLSSAGRTPLVGREALAKFAGRLHPGLRHVVFNVHVDGNGDDARGRAYFAAYTVAERPPTLLVTGRYRDTLTRASGTWLFAERQATPDA
jgi:hypothetical protein